jgi:hypothetical protein
MNILDFACLRAGYTPAQLGLPDSVLDNAGNLGHDGGLFQVRFWRPYTPKPKLKPYVIFPLQEQPRDFFRTSEVTRQESERAGEVERQAVRLAEAHALKGK